MIWRHAGEYSGKKNAEIYAQSLRDGGLTVKIVPRTVYDVMIKPVAQNLSSATKEEGE